MNLYLVSKIPVFMVLNLGNSELLPAIHALNIAILNYNIVHPE